jgi:flagellar hook-associated protein 3 FlgL
MSNNDMQYFLRRQEERLNEAQNRIAGGSRILVPRDDPLAASHAVRYDSYLARLERFEKNALYARDHHNEVDGYLARTNDIMQRIRELTVAGATGTYTAEDQQYIATEMNELLKELVSLANAPGADGGFLFSGDKTFTEPFRIVEGTVAGSDGSPEMTPMVVRVEYRGAGSSRRTEISERTYGDLDIGGGEAFWAEKMQIFSGVDGANYRAANAGSFFIDGIEIPVSAGDTLHAIVAIINDSAAPVKAYVDPDTRGLNIEGTNPHLIRMEDAAGSRTLQDLGVIAMNSDPAAPNWHPAARVSGGSLFDMVIRVRDALFRGDQDFAGSQGLGGIDLAMGNVRSRMALNGSRAERAESAWQKLNMETYHVQAEFNREASINPETAYMDLGMIDFARRATLQTSAKVLPPTLLDFLR